MLHSNSEINQTVGPRNKEDIIAVDYKVSNQSGGNQDLTRHGIAEVYYISWYFFLAFVKTLSFNVISS